MVKPYCELVVKEILPGVRALLAGELIKSGLTQAKAAAKLGVTQAAISQYTRELRGWKVQKISKDAAITAEIQKFSKKLVESDTDSVTMHGLLCNVCRIARSRGLLCEGHRQVLAGLDGCKLCIEK
ncbi:MAG: helix-turn-helix domain-containing protein [Candidatus Aenigmatarchaeota archaeon]|nr:helix-turn-helix domain-containing protein [Candidatus Aenigmarchaeota archaeon]